MTGSVDLPTAILFDMDDTLIRAYGRPREAWAKTIAEFTEEIRPLSVEEATDAITEFAVEFWADAARHKHWRLRIIDARREVVRGGLERTGRFGADGPDFDLVEAMGERFERLRHEEMAPFPGAYETLDELKDRGVRLGLITNGSSEPQRAKVTRFGLEHRFDHIQIEGEHGFGKPEEQAYLHAMDVLDVGPTDTWMVGDNLEWEVVAPQKLGIHAIWFDGYGDGLPTGTDIRPDRIITRLSELLEPLA